MSRWFVIIGSVLLVAFGGVYAYLGGFAKPDVALVTTEKPVFLAGQYYAGIPDNDFGKLFTKANDLQRSGRVRGTLGNIYYNDPEKEGEEVKAFIGLVVADTISQQLPEGYRYRTFAAGQKVLRARVNAHFMLAPGRLYDALKDAAEQQKLKMQKVYLEQFPEDAPAEMLVVVQ
jgi:hypothetical protein